MAERERHFVVVALSTVGSRVLGLVRDMVAFGILGTGLLNSAFLLAFTLPNLFRRLLGEGALTSALVPVLARRRLAAGDRGFFELLEAVTWRVGLALLGLVIAGGVLLQALPRIMELPAHWELGAGLAQVLLPYLFLVCLAAVFGAALNLRERFGLHALSQVWLNIAQILALAVGAAWFATTDEGRIGWLCAGVLVGGLAQALVPAAALRREGWAGGGRWQAEGLRDLWSLLLPGLAGAAVMQVNLAVTRVLAFAVSDDAVAVLYLASRLIELPLGVFVVTVTTVRFPELALLAQGGDRHGAARCHREAAREIWTITLPAAAGLALLAEPILSVLFGRGRFGAEEAALTAGPVAMYALALPLYGLTGLATRGLHAFGDMVTPSRIAVVNFVLNAGLCLALMRPYGILGLAAANVIATAVHALLLDRAWRRCCPEVGDRRAGWAGLAKLVLATAVMVALVLGGRWGLGHFAGTGRLADWLTVLILVPAGAAAYLGMLWAFGGPERARLARLAAGLRRR